MRYAMSRRRRNLLAAVLTLVAAAVVLLDHSCIKQAIVEREQSVVSQEAADLQKYNGKQFKVVKVIDGDTLDIDVPDGNFLYTRIRLWGVDTPETKDPRTGPMYFGREAVVFSAGAAMGKRVTIHLEQNSKTRDKYRRLLAYVQLPDGKFLNEELLKEGYAYADLRFKHSLYNKYKQLETLAKKQKKGLWENVRPEQMPKWKQKRENFTTQNTELAEINN